MTISRCPDWLRGLIVLETSGPVYQRVYIAMFLAFLFVLIFRAHLLVPTSEQAKSKIVIANFLIKSLVFMTYGRNAITLVRSLCDFHITYRESLVYSISSTSLRNSYPILGSIERYLNRKDVLVLKPTSRHWSPGCRWCRGVKLWNL